MTTRRTASAALAALILSGAPAAAQLGTPATVGFCTVHESCAEGECARSEEPNFEIRERDGGWVLRVESGEGEPERLGPYEPVDYAARGWSVTVPGEVGSPARTLHLNRSGRFVIVEVGFPGPDVRLATHEGRCLMARVP